MVEVRAVARRSKVLRAISRAADRFRTAANTSAVGRPVATFTTALSNVQRGTTAVESETVVGRGSDVRSVLRGSAVVGAYHRFEATLGTAVEHATLTRLVATARTYAQNAWCYRWLTTEPDPDVVVIDLRRTRSVGPALAVLDRAVAAIAPGLERASVVSAVERVADVVRQRPVAVVSTSLLGLATASLLASITDGEPNRGLLAVQIAVLPVAALGLRSRTTLSELRSTRTAQFLVAVFEPPDPPSERDPARGGNRRTEDGEQPVPGPADDETDEEGNKDNPKG